MKLPDNLTFEQAGKLGYIGTSYGALRMRPAGPGQVAFIDGITGTLGVAATVLALAWVCPGSSGPAGTRNCSSGSRRCAPNRDRSAAARRRSRPASGPRRTGGEGADFVISALGAKAPAATMLDSMRGVRRGGRVVNVGGVADELPLDVKWLMDEQVQVIGSNWFTTAQGQEMADMVDTGTWICPTSNPGDSHCPRSTPPSPGSQTATAGSATTS